MGKIPKTYLDFAENDYVFFRKALDNNIRGNALASIGQNICERYLKHVVSEYSEPENKEEESDKEHILRTHSLLKLIRYIQDDMGIKVPEEIEDELERINGYYFTTRYPGTESFFASDRDIEKVAAAVESTRDLTYEVCREMEQEVEQEIEPELDEKETQNINDIDYDDLEL